MHGISRNVIFERKNGMDYNREIRHRACCLHCGDEIRYGRKDKKFCSDDCRASHHNEALKESRAFRRRVLSRLTQNHEILLHLLETGVDSCPLIELSSHGFSPDLMTSCRKVGKHMECSCFEIKYIMTASRIYSISKIQNVSLNLQNCNK